MQVREYATITTSPDVTPSLDVGVVSQATFDWLADHASRSKKDDRVLYVNNRKELKLGSYVGYLQSPTGESIEILPKTSQGNENILKSRRTLQLMLKAAISLPPREYEAADLMRANTPIHDWVFSQFLVRLKALLTRGLRFDYEQIDDESPFVKGQILFSRQQRQPPGKGHLTNIRHDIFTPNRIENRLLKTALSMVQASCESAENWRLANELCHQLESVDPISQPLQVMQEWRSSKLMSYYDDIRPWCELVLERLNPNFQQGHHRGIALLFPMERLFEKYVEVCLKRELPRESQLKAQAKSEFLLKHRPNGSSREADWFQLKPDLLLQSPNSHHVLDAKWKLLDQLDTADSRKYNIKQSDLYQLFAYGQKYQDGKGHLMLIYPMHEVFYVPLPPFKFDDQLTLWVVPFCVEDQCLVEGQWQEFFPGLISESRRELSAVNP